MVCVWFVNTTGSVVFIALGSDLRIFPVMKLLHNLCFYIELKKSSVGTTSHSVVITSFQFTIIPVNVVVILHQYQAI